MPSASTRLASAKRSGGPSTGSSERSRITIGLVALDRRLDGRLERNAVAVDVASELLGAADEHGGDDEIVDLLERRADDGRIVLAVDDRDHASHPLVVTSSSMRPVYFSYANVSVENWMMRSSPWNGWRREIET